MAQDYADTVAVPADVGEARGLLGKWVGRCDVVCAPSGTAFLIDASQERVSAACAAAPAFLAQVCADLCEVCERLERPYALSVRLPQDLVLADALAIAMAWRHAATPRAGGAERFCGVHLHSGDVTTAAVLRLLKTCVHGWCRCEVDACITAAEALARTQSLLYEPVA